MKKNFLCLMEGVLFSLPLLFASCGNGDNALEEIINGGGSEGGGSSAINATAITLKQTMKVLVKGGDALTITATATPAEATLTWESSDEAVATVVNGVVTPVGAGIATITAKSGDVTATCEVFVGNEVDLGTKTDDYTVQNYDILKGTLDDSYAISIPNDSKVTFNGMKTKKQITCSGDATIILADGSENDGEAGIKIGGTGTTLTINGETAGDGILTVKGGSDGAGIGTNKDETGGNIVINGGRVTATGGAHAAGIGTGNAEYNTNECGSITINGGTVTAKGGSYGAGIGTGCAYNLSNTCGAITINGGTVTATGGQIGAGIGTGWANMKPNTCGAITIDTGVTSVTATKGTGIGSFNSIGTGVDSGGTQKCGKITIGGVVKDQSEFTGATYTYAPSN